MANYGQGPYGQPGYSQPGYGGSALGGQPGYGPSPVGGQVLYGNPIGSQQSYPSVPYGVPAGQGYGMQGGTWPGQQIDPQVQQWFMAVDRDRSGRITAVELQQALVNANWTSFNPETCRLMIGMFDKDQTGTIELAEFQGLWNYIQQWRSVFERFDSNRTGNIEAHELGLALNSMGYNLSPQFMQMCICKFDFVGRRSMKLDDFIQCCVMVKSLTDMFVARDTQRSGRVTLTYEDFITMAVLNKP